MGEGDLLWSVVASGPRSLLWKKATATSPARWQNAHTIRIPFSFDLPHKSLQDQLMQKIKWGILGCGHIAEKFAKSLASVEGGELVACASRTPGKAEAFAKAVTGAKSFSDYEPLLSDLEVDAVYVATTHNFHCENVLLALEYDKAVLCEKPLGVNADESRRMAVEAQKRKLFLMEAMWTRFLPAIQQMKHWLDEDRIGQVKVIRADFSFNKPFDAESRLYNPELAGGALLDVGIYPVSLASFVMGTQPERVAALATFAETGVDETTLVNFGYADGAMAQLSCGITSASENRAEIVGTKGRIILPDGFHGATNVELCLKDAHQEKLRLPYVDSEGFRFEIEAVHQALREGKRESSIMPVSESVAIAETMDRILHSLKG